jgi:hypothetical protein
MLFINFLTDNCDNLKEKVIYLSVNVKVDEYFKIHSIIAPH